MSGKPGAVQTVQRYFYPWRDGGPWQRINHQLLMAAREAAGREASPTAGVIDSQSVKTTEAGGPCGYDGAKKIKGCKRHILTDTMGLLVTAIVHAADVQDRDGAPPLLGSIRSAFPWLRHVFADSGYAGDKLKAALNKLGHWTVEIVKRAATANGFAVVPRRWVVERTLAWLTAIAASPRTSRPPSRAPLAWLIIASLKLLSRRLART